MKEKELPEHKNNGESMKKKNTRNIQKEKQQFT